MKRGKKTARALLWPLAFVAAGQASAAGGHHSVDDANILDRGKCEQAGWFTHDDAGGNLLHAGLNCRVGPVQLGLAGEHARASDSSATAWNVEAKWAHEVAAGFKVGLDVQPVWQTDQHPRFQATRLATLATWSPRPTLAVHLNLGRDFVRSGPDLARDGVGVDWTVQPAWMLTAERFLQDRTHFVRAGVRWEGGRSWKLDFSRAQRLAGPSPSNWTVGLTYEFGGK
jgi:hypothetical protein